MPQLTLPTALKDKLLWYIQPVGIQILKWIEYHLRCCSFDLSLPKKFSWTPHGTIDKKKTTKMLIKDDCIDIVTRFKLACSYCLEEDIPDLWNKISKRQKLYSFERKFPDFSKQGELLDFWLKYIREKDNLIMEKIVCSSDPFMLGCAICGNKAVTEYFLEKFVKTEEFLLITALYILRSLAFPVTNLSPPGEYLSEILCFLFSKMNDKQQMQIFSGYHIQVLDCLLHWPWQNLFVETANHLFSLHPFGCFDVVLELIIHKVEVGYKDFDYKKMLVKLWQETPDYHRRHFISDNNFFRIVNKLLHIKYCEIIKFIFQDVSLTRRKKIIFSYQGQTLCEDLIYCEEWDLLKFIVPLCMSSKDETLKFKQKFEEHIQRNKSKTVMFSNNICEKDENKLKEFFQFLDDVASGCDKRKSLDGDDSNPAKRLGNIKF